MENKRISPTFLNEDYEKIKELVGEKNMSKFVRDSSLEALDGKLNSQNIEFLAPIIREQLDIVLAPYMERIISLLAKTCIQSGTAAYLSADAIYKFVPEEQREDVSDSYIEARKRAVSYMKNKTEKGDI